MIEIFIIVGGLIFVFIIFYIFKKRKRKQKDWFLFEKVEGYENRPKKSYFVIHKKTGIRRPVYSNAIRKTSE